MAENWLTKESLFATHARLQCDKSVWIWSKRMRCNEDAKLAEREMADLNCPCALRVHVDLRANLAAAEWLNRSNLPFAL